MESTPALLQQLLQLQPPGFTALTAPSLWMLMISYIAVPYGGRLFTAAELTLISSIVTTSMQYMRHFSASPSIQCPCKARAKTELKAVMAQSAAIIFVCPLLMNPDQHSSQQLAMQQLLSNPALTEAAVISVAGLCQSYHKQHDQQLKKQQQAFQAASGRSMKGKLRSSSRTSRSTTTSSSGSSSSPSGPANPSPTSFLQLEIPPDHQSFAVGLANAAVKWENWLATILSGLSLGQGPIVVLRETSQVRSWMSWSIGENALGAGNSRPFGGTAITLDHLQLLLEALALAGAEVERDSSGKGRLLPSVMRCLEVLGIALGQAAVAERVAFVDTRGDLLIQACNLVLSAINADDEQQQQEQQQQQRGQQEKQQHLRCSTEVCRASVIWIVVHCTILPGHGEFQSWVWLTSCQCIEGEMHASHAHTWWYKDSAPV